MNVAARTRRCCAPACCALWTALAAGGCVVEKIDAIIAEHGVTYWPSSTAGDEASSASSTSTGTSTSTSTSTTIDSSSEPGDPHGASATSDEPETTSSSGSGNTGPDGPICGNGVVDGEESCDDGNADPDDGCKECESDSVVFISSEVYRGYELGGILGADQRCRSLAAKAGLLRAESFRAWLSTPTDPAADRLHHSRGRYKLVNGIVIARDWASLTSGVLLSAITADENSQLQDTAAWTGTLANGQPAPGSEFCGDWDNDAGQVLYGGAGESIFTDAGWSYFSDAVCLSQFSIYCFEN